MKFAEHLTPDELALYNDMIAQIKKLQRDKSNIYTRAKLRSYRAQENKASEP